MSFDDLFSDLSTDEKEEDKKKEKPKDILPAESPEILPGQDPVSVASDSLVEEAIEESSEQGVPESSSPQEEPLAIFDKKDTAVVLDEADPIVEAEIPVTDTPIAEVKTAAKATDLFGSPEEGEEQPIEEKVIQAPSKPISATELFAKQPEPEKVEKPIIKEAESPIVVQEEPVAKSDGMFSSRVLEPIEALPAPVLPEMPAEFDVSSDKGGHSKVFMIYGEKGESKTTLALSFPGKIYAISFDRKTVEVWLSMFKGDKRIDVKDALRYMNWSSPEARLKSSDISLRYIDALIEEARKFEPDWILIDATGGYTKMAEMTMRYRNSIGMTQGVSWPFWTERRLYIKQLHLKALGIAKRGIIYTAFVGVREKIENNKIVETTDQPKWVDVVKDETDVAIRVKAKLHDDGMKYTTTVDSSKWGSIKTGIKVDITVPEGEIPDCFDRIIEASRSKESRSK